jgi:hypothetical protein
MIIIEKQYLENFYLERDKLKIEMQNKLIDINPIALKNNLFMLPDICLFDETFSKIFVNFKDYTMRVI